MTFNLLQYTHTLLWSTATGKMTSNSRFKVQHSRNLAGSINQEAGDNTQAGAFLFGVFDLEGIREFLAIHEAKSFASQVIQEDKWFNEVCHIPDTLNLDLLNLSKQRKSPDN
ncbi:uncharacterized protein LOC134180370 isoform X2 [Corticium candelabrum]|uniref:uncharacterized protein LOC134180370 isoform X2 n=2 Tax=Corticium candelabrum TaxID=121492 RepID=UPI002E26B6FE|nr:uncharacterized protein LOC134180370 isoform X2 [Corticium candelabrum]